MIAEKQRVEVGGRSIAYREQGTGHALVLLHGFLCDSRCWRTQLDGLSDAFRVLAWDAPGAGASADPPESFTITDWAECLAGFLDATGADEAHVLGLSWGGLLAQEFYRLHPGRVATLVLADTYAGWKGSLPAEACAQRLARCEWDSWLPADEFASRWVPEMFSEGAPRDVLRKLSAIFSDFHPFGFRLMAKSLAVTDTRDVLPEIDVPTLILWGDDDRRSPIAIAEQLRDAIPNATLEVIAHAGHVSNMEQPDAFNSLVRRFLSSA